MPLGQFYILDNPDIEFTGNYQIDTVNDKSFPSRVVLEIQKQAQPVEAFRSMSIGQDITFVSSSGEATHVYLISETENHFIFSSRG